MMCQVSVTRAKLTDDARQVAEKEYQRISQMNPASAEYTVARSYLDWILDLPWQTSTQDTLDIGGAAQVLDRDHYALEKVMSNIFLRFLRVQ